MRLHMGSHHACRVASCLRGLLVNLNMMQIVIRLEEFNYHGAAALGCVMLIISFLGLWAINYLQNWGRRRHTAGR